MNSLDIFSLSSYAFLVVRELFQKVLISSLNKINNFILFSHKFGLLLLELHNSLIKLGQLVVHSFFAIITITIFNLLIRKWFCELLKKLSSMTNLISKETKKFLKLNLLFSSRRFHFSFINDSNIFKAKTRVLLD